MDQTAMEAVIIEHVKQILPQQIEIELTTKLLETGIDSMSFIRLVVLLEEAFNIVIEDEEILLENFTSVETIRNLIRKCLDSKG
ncbi:acyl carrier protein [Paenibacillus chitinolyticus]|uniref:Acyl carrier protein n=1 Tax=Paenibacillus chitinolyticus TaxID=79263 RepID=A0A410WSP3_9BACL|nr:acyl carrier protein [Paenibacillus chitinolyticus]MCY9591251.1 acyl carrier protein [Paenibacillus chitinolyticus]MCY9595566.1 acyl carrier protein [Paenibacillus chitinolyticus]QAV17330.1 acyl carrier protein [Paenibacillus chitinolyticus]